MTHIIFNRSELFKKRVRAYKMPDDHRFLNDWVQKQFNERLDLITRDFPKRLDITPHNDPFDVTETLNADKDYDLITSNLTLHNINDLPGALIQIKRSLKPDGAFMAALFGGETLHELRDSLTHTETNMHGGLSPRMHPLTTKQDMGALMQRAGFALPVVDSERVSVSYKSLTSLIQDLRGMGETNVLMNKNTTYIGEKFIKRAEAYYLKNHAERGQLIATFDIIFLLGWAPHDSQQKPLKRGSADTHLSEVL